MDTNEARDNLRAAIAAKFEDAPQTRAVFELREEISANSMERFEDLLGGGMEPDAAVKSVVDSIGDVNDLVRALPNDDMPDIWYQENRERAAMVSTICVGLYILAGVVAAAGLLLGGLRGSSMFMTGGVILAGLICIIPTCLLVYNAKMHPGYVKKDKTLVEEFKKWASDDKRNKELRKGFSGFLWTLVVVLYFVISFTTGAWYITWIIFLIGTCLEALVNLVFNLRNSK